MTNEEHCKITDNSNFMIDNTNPNDMKIKEETYQKARTDVIAEISREMRVLYGNEYEKQIRVDTITECLRIVQKIKDDYNDALFGDEKQKQVPINYGTICGIIIAFERLIEETNNLDGEKI